MFRHISNVFSQMLNWLTLLTRSLGEVFVLLLVVLVAYDVFSRYVLNQPTQIADEIAAYMLIGIVFLGAAHALRKDLHIRVTMVTDHIPEKVRNWLLLVGEIAVLAFVVVIVWQASKLVAMSLDSTTKSNSMLRTPLFIPQLIIPVGLGVFSLEILRGVIRQAKELIKRGE